MRRPSKMRLDNLLCVDDYRAEDAAAKSSVGLQEVEEVQRSEKLLHSSFKVVSPVAKLVKFDQVTHGDQAVHTSLESSPSARLDEQDNVESVGALDDSLFSPASSSSGRRTTLSNAITPLHIPTALNRAFDATSQQLNQTWELLRPAEKMLLMRVSLFPGSFSFMAAQAVNQGASERTEQQLGRLSRTHLLHVDPIAARFSMHRGLQRALQKRLEHGGVDVQQIQQQLLRFFVGEARRINDIALLDNVPSYLECRRQFDRDVHNILFSFHLSEKQGDWRSYRQLIVATIYTIRYMFPAVDCIVLLQKLLKHMDFDEGAVDGAQRLSENPNSREDAYLYASLARAYIDARDYKNAEVYVSRALRLYDTQTAAVAGDRELQKNQAQALQNLGEIRLALARYEEAVEALMRAVKIRDSLGQRGSIPFATALVPMAVALYRWGKFDDAEKLFEEILKIYDACDLAGTHAYSRGLLYIARTHQRRGEMDSAQMLCEQALECCDANRNMSIGNVRSGQLLEISIQECLASILEDQDDTKRALTWYRVAMRNYNELEFAQLRDADVEHKVKTGFARCKQRLYRTRKKSRDGVQRSGKKSLPSAVSSSGLKKVFR